MFGRRCAEGGVSVVEREHVTDGREDLQFSQLHREARVGCAAEEAVERFDFAALALPSHEDPLLGIPLTFAVKEEEAVLSIVPVERFDSFPSGSQARVVPSTVAVWASLKSVKRAKWR